MLKYLRKEIQAFPNYQVPNLQSVIKLDANEGQVRQDGLHLYPVDRGDQVRERLGILLKIDPSKIILGNGSSELLDIILKTYLEYKEIVVSVSPTFSMYEQYTVIQQGIYKEFPLTNLQHLNLARFLDFIEITKPKLIIICNPNNPTGSLMLREDLIKIISSVAAMVVVDEAYIEFADQPEKSSLIKLIDKFPNLIVLRTFSKAFGLAGIRLGYALAQQETIECLHKVRSPYNVGTLAQKEALEALSKGLPESSQELIRSERERVEKFLNSLEIKPFYSQTNFLFFKAPPWVYNSLLSKGILIRKFTGELKGYYRLTIGSPQQNKAVIAVLKEVVHV